MADQDGQENPEKTAEQKANDPQKIPVGKRVGEILLYLVFIIADAEGVWPRNHGLALLFFIGGTIGLALYDGAFSNKQVVGVGIISVLVSTVIYFWAGPILPEETENHGWLQPANEKTEYHPPKGMLLFVLGGNLFGATANYARVLTVGSCVMMSVERNGDQLAFNADIHDEKGELVARIVRNEFHLIAGKYSYRDRSDDRSDLTVFDKNGDPMLEIYYANKTTVFITGEFACSDGIKVRVMPHAAFLDTPRVKDFVVTENYGTGTGGFVFTMDGVGF
jgi:hypothetical protein